MITVDIQYEDGLRQSSLHALPLTVGRSGECGIRIAHWRIAKKHFLLSRGADGCYIEDLGSIGGTRVNGQRITRYGPLKPTDACIAGPCLLHISRADAEVDVVQIDREQPENTPTSALIHAPVPTEQGASTSNQDAIGANNHKFPELRRLLHAALIEAFDLRRHDVSALSDDALRQDAYTTVAKLLNTYPEVSEELEKQTLIRLVVDEAVGLGVLESLLGDPEVTEIMVNRYNEIFAERAGMLLREPTGFSSEAAVRAVIDRIVFPLGRRIDESSPMVDARLKDGSRMNAVIPPIALRGACLTIRKFPQYRLKLSDLVSRQSMSQSMADLLALCIKLRLNIVVSGGTGSGKTTLLNILGEAIAWNQRLITIEDSAELQIHHPHALSLEARPENSEGHGKVAIRDLVRNAMRMRPDRIIIGEVRGVEALDMLIAMNTGHEGSLTTLHANSPRDALSRLETMVLMANIGLPLQAIREQICSAIHIVIQQSRLACGRRVISHIAEVSGIESGTIQMQTLMHFEHTSQQFIRSALPPVFFDTLDRQAEPCVRDWFVLS